MGLRVKGRGRKGSDRERKSGDERAFEPPNVRPDAQPPERPASNFGHQVWVLGSSGYGFGFRAVGAVLNLRTTAYQRCGAVPRKARISGS